MPSRLGFQVQEERGPDQSITRLGCARTAFVGRTLRGPVDRPVFLRSFTEFQTIFGGLWQPSPLGYAVEQFFDNGGREALVVRVVNGARAVSLSLAAGGGTLRLRALRPGTREFLRASVDYDNVPPEASQEFNLTVQRVRSQNTEQVEDQEIFRRISVDPAAERCVLGALEDSELVRVQGALPMLRPNRTFDGYSGSSSGYVKSSADGDDGAPLSDYDLIGSQSAGTGLFALGFADPFNLLCLPPLSRDMDVGPSALLVAARYCKERRALLIVDPPTAWCTADDALRGMLDWPFANENALMYFPRILAHDKLRGHSEVFAPCGAVAGMLARLDEAAPVWASPSLPDAVLRPGYRPACLVPEDRRARLASLGVNSIQGVRSAVRGPRARTLAGGTAGAADWQDLGSRRLALFILNSVEHGTRWVAFANAVVDVAELASAQITSFFERLHEAGAFGARPLDESYFVICDQRVNSVESRAAGEFHILLGFAAERRSEYHSFRVAHTMHGSKVQPVSVNRLNMAPFSAVELEWVERLACQLQS